MNLLKYRLPILRNTIAPDATMHSLADSKAYQGLDTMGYYTFVHSTAPNAQFSRKSLINGLALWHHLNIAPCLTPIGIEGAMQDFRELEYRAEHEHGDHITYTVLHLPYWLYESISMQGADCPFGHFKGNDRRPLTGSRYVSVRIPLSIYAVLDGFFKRKEFLDWFREFDECLRITPSNIPLLMLWDYLPGWFEKLDDFRFSESELLSLISAMRANINQAGRAVAKGESESKVISVYIPNWVCSRANYWRGIPRDDSLSGISQVLTNAMFP